MIPPPAGLRHRRNGQSPITSHHVLASAGRYLAWGIEMAGRPAGGGMIPSLTDRSGITSTPLRLPLRARRIGRIYDNAESIRRASAGSQRAWYTMRRAGGHRQVGG
jgi:hypothetical protein